MGKALLVAFAIVLFFLIRRRRKSLQNKSIVCFIQATQWYIDVSLTLSEKFCVILSTVKNPSGALFELASL